MAQITFNLDELLEIIKANKVLPEQVTKMEVNNDSINFIISTNNFLIPYVPATLHYVEYENNNAIFELNIVGGQFNKALGFFSKSLQSKLPEYIKLELPKIIIDLQKLLEQKNIKGIRIKEITQESSRFDITIESI